MSSACLPASIVRVSFVTDDCGPDDEPSESYGYEDDDDESDDEMCDEDEVHDEYDHVPQSVTGTSWKIAVEGPVGRASHLTRSAQGICAKLGWGNDFLPAVRRALEGKKSFGPVQKRLTILDRYGVTARELDHVVRLRAALSEHEQMSANVYLRSYYTAHVTWEDALDLVRFFGLGVEELERLVLDLHAYWYSHSSVVQQHPSFLRWVRRHLLYERTSADVKRMVRHWLNTRGDAAA